MNAILKPEDLFLLFERIFQKHSDTFIYEAYSQINHDLVVITDFSNAKQYAKAVLSNPKRFIHLNIWFNGAGPKPIIRKVSLDPQKCNGHTYRFLSEGWGLVNLQYTLKLRPGYDRNCVVSANSEKRAQKWSANYPNFGDPTDWDWAVAASRYRWLSREVKKLYNS